MRVVGGVARGIPLRTARTPGLRPTMDRVRAAIFSMLEARQAVTGARVLDLYAGTGSLGIEALSRGAAWADFVERDPRHCALIRANLERTGLAGLAAVHAWPVIQAVERLAGPYDLALMDPPYAEAASLGPLATALLSAGRLRSGAALLVEQGARDAGKLGLRGLRLLQRRTYGDTAVLLYAVGEEAA